MFKNFFKKVQKREILIDDKIFVWRRNWVLFHIIMKLCNFKSKSFKAFCVCVYSTRRNWISLWHLWQVSLICLMFWRVFATLEVSKNFLVFVDWIFSLHIFHVDIWTFIFNKASDALVETWNFCASIAKLNCVFRFNYNIRFNSEPRWMKIFMTLENNLRRKQQNQYLIWSDWEAAKKFLS